MPVTRIAFTTAINVPNLKYCKVLRATDVDDTAGTMVVELLVYGNDGTRHPTTWRLSVANGMSDVLRAPAGIPKTIDDIIVSDTKVSTPTGFNQVMGAYTSAGTEAMLTAMLALGIIAIPGTVATV